jgi:hypothetical protein
MSMKKGESLVGLLDARRRTLEDAFFRKRDAILAEQFHKLEKMKETKQALQKVSGITDEKVLDKLVSLNVRPETLASLAMVPLVEIAWADGSIQAEERDAILKATVKNGFAKGSTGYALTESWLSRRPPDSLLEAWTHYIEGLCANLNKTQIAHLRTCPGHRQGQRWIPGAGQQDFQGRTGHDRPAQGRFRKVMSEPVIYDCRH